MYALGERKSDAAAHSAKIPDRGSVMLKSEAKDKASCKLGRVVDQIIGKDGELRGLKLKSGNGFFLYVVEPPFQLVRNLEIEGEYPNYKLKPRSGSVFTNSETNQEDERL